MRSRRIATLAVLVLWVLLGPVGMALSGCMMMDGCDALCGAPSLAAVITTGLFAQTSTFISTSIAFSPQNIWSAPDSPPKSAPTLL
jgi:hypothetical protein